MGVCGIRALRAFAAVLVLVLLVAACGTRRSSTDIAAAAGVGVITAPSPTIPGATPVPGPASGSTGGTGGGSPTTTGSTGSSFTTTGSVSTGTSGTAAGPLLSPIRIGIVGTISGIGGTQRGSVQAVQAWAQWINARGGLHRHLVEVIVVDDGGDPARHRAAVQELVEQRRVVAFVGNISGFSISEAAVRYLEQKRVPVVGGDRLSTFWNSSPMMFPQAAAGEMLVWVHMANTARLAPKGAAIGWLTCQEAQICRDADRLWQVYGPKVGLELKYRAQVSVAQPNFTAECIRAREAGVKWFLLGTDANSIRRIGSSCAQQGYFPRFAVLQTSDEMAAEPGLQGGYFGSSTFPWVYEGSAGAREFHEVTERYAPGLTLSAHTSSGWVAAKLFERAASRIGEPPTSAQILEGLWSMRNEDLGGLTSPLTFQRNKPTPIRFCYFPMEIRAKRWIVTDGGRKVCRSPE